jgi:hypothetical protein
MTGALTVAVRTLALVALGEFLLVRIALRLGPAFPSGRVVDTGFDVVFWLGLWLMNAAGALAIAVVAIQAAQTRRDRLTGSAPGVVAAVATGIVLAAWVLSLVGTSSTRLLLVQVAAISTAAVAMAALSAWRGWRRWWLLSVAAAYVAAGGHFIARVAATPWAPTGAITMAELLALSAAVLAPTVWQAGWRPRAAVAAAAIVLVWAGFAGGQPHIARFLVIWDLGLSSPLPWWAFGLALGGLTYAVVGSGFRLGALGFAVVALAGFRLDYTYFGLLALAGFAVLASSPAPFTTLAPRTGRAALAIRPGT